MSASFYPNMTDLLREINGDIAKDIIKEGQPIVLVDEYSWYRETLSLMAKQVNLCDSCVTLLEQGMEQEAYILARSQFNNMLWIRYICEGEDNSRVKEYYYQPHINQILANKGLKNLINEFGNQLDHRLLANDIIERLDNGISENERILSQENLSKQPKKISDLAKRDVTLFGMYVTLYNEGSKFEHSDISKTKLYRKQVIDGCDIDQVFVFDLGESNKECWLTVFKYSFMSIFFAFDAIRERITTREDQLFLPIDGEPAAYTMKDFEKITLKFAICQRMLNQNRIEI